MLTVVIAVLAGLLVSAGLRLSHLLKWAGLVASNREAARRLAEGSVKVDGDVMVEDVSRPVRQWWGATVQVGKRKWVRISEPGAV